MYIPKGIVIPPIVVDTREQLPYQFGEHPVIIDGLKTGDYSIQGLESSIAVERKELDDFVGCCGKSRDRFVRELQRASGLRRFWVIIEGSLREMEKSLYFSKIHPNAVLGTLVAWENRFPVHFWFCGDRDLGERMTKTILFRAYLDDWEGKVNGEKRFYLVVVAGGWEVWEKGDTKRSGFFLDEFRARHFADLMNGETKSGD